MISAHNNTSEIKKIMLEEAILDLPKCNVETFQDFDNQLKTDQELVKKMVRICL